MDVLKESLMHMNLGSGGPKLGEKILRGSNVKQAFARDLGLFPDGGNFWRKKLLVTLA